MDAKCPSNLQKIEFGDHDVRLICARVRLILLRLLLRLCHGRSTEVVIRNLQVVSLSNGR